MSCPGGSRPREEAAAKSADVGKPHTGSNPLSSSGESANPRSLSMAARSLRMALTRTACFSAKMPVKASR